MKTRSSKGISTAIGAVLFIILIFTLQIILFLAVYTYNSSIQEAINTENERIQERMILASLKTDNSSGVEEIIALRINNTGAITVRIRAIYVDSQFVCDPSNRTINADDTYVNAKEASWILLPSGVYYNASSKITAATERGTKSTDYEGRLKPSEGGVPPAESPKFYLGPLMLDFTKFFYAEVNPQTGDPISEWKPGWGVEAGTGAIAWNITVKNIDDRNITINQFSGFTVWPNDEPASRRPWYMDPPAGLLTRRINSNQTVQIIYKWSTPKVGQVKPQSIYTTICRLRTFLTFFGIFHEHDGTTKPYGQTIPFEAVLIEKPKTASIRVTASPDAIAIRSSMTSTITATVTRGAVLAPVAGANVTFTATAGQLSNGTSNLAQTAWAITNTNGIATAYISALTQTTPTDANVTASWLTITGSTIVHLVVETIQVTSSLDVIQANSSMKSTITATIKVGGNPIANARVAFTTTAGTLSSPSALTNLAGTAKVNLTAGALPTAATVTATWINTSNSTTIRFMTLQATASPTTIAIKSTMPSTITATLLGPNPVGTNITFTATTGTLSNSWATTDATGRARVNLTAASFPAVATVTAYWSTLSTFITVRFTAETILVTASPDVIAANSTMKSTIIAIVTLSGSPVEGANVTFSTNAGSLSTAFALTGTDGRAKVDLTPGSYPATGNVTAIWINTVGYAIVRFETATVEVTSSTPLFVTSSVINSTITALVKLGTNPVVGANVIFSVDDGILSQQSATTNSFGIAEVNLQASWTDPADINLTAAWMTFSNHTIVHFPTMHVETDNASYFSNETAHIEGLLRYVSGMPIENAVASIEIAAPNGTVIWSDSNTTDSAGLFMYDLDLQLINVTPGTTYTVTTRYQDSIAACSFEVRT